MKKRGQLVELPNGKKGIIYNNEQNRVDGKLFIRVVDDNYVQLKDDKTGRELISLKLPEEIKTIGYTD
jgi:hypothetical protein